MGVCGGYEQIVDVEDDWVGLDSHPSESDAAQGVVHG
jgi:hypothetical protein